ncbi:hypothetical protein KUH03_32685 [Sphingobacterium sp. E70]|uniref:hypothetical protein n=1 Tax=Sphingobacterium sp. E70 TaxID=2853439 RepID=UPI00211B80FB|nr:hypothetical protein [Sphingobacterium sp. E70]ULT23851.1 hypothetical protein KUH03_32685 [Sphingobacterium sp. E70]
MKKHFAVLVSIIGLVGLLSMKDQQKALYEELQLLYRRPISEWPKPTIDAGVSWKEFKSLPKVDTSYFSLMEKPDVKLGKYLFLIRYCLAAIRSLVAAVTIPRHHGLIN